MKVSELHLSSFSSPEKGSDASNFKIYKSECTPLFFNGSLKPGIAEALSQQPNTAQLYLTYPLLTHWFNEVFISVDPVPGGDYPHLQ